MPISWTFNSFLGCQYISHTSPQVTFKSWILTSEKKGPSCPNWGQGGGDSGNARKKTFFFCWCLPLCTSISNVMGIPKIRFPEMPKCSIRHYCLTETWWTYFDNCPPWTVNTLDIDKNLETSSIDWEHNTTPGYTSPLLSEKRRYSQWWSRLRRDANFLQQRTGHALSFISSWLWTSYTNFLLCLC